jgi:hypothetical protein
MHTRREILGAAIVAMFVPASCTRRDTRPRCAQCGMRIAPGSHWEAGAIDSHGTELRFDTPGCLFRYRFAHDDVRAPWVTEYYARAGVRSPAEVQRYAVGSDVIGPMGADLVPIAPEREAAFRRDHHARAVLAWSEVTAATIRDL